MTNIFKKNMNKHIVAIFDFDNTVKAAEAGTLGLPYDNKLYLQLINAISSKCETMKGLKGFIRKQGLNKKDCLHFWEGKITNGYTIVGLYYSAKATPEIQRLCDNNLFTFLCTRE